MKLTDIARISHEVNRSYSQAMGMSVSPSWDEAPQWMKDSQIDGTQYAMTNPALTPEDVHNNWIEHKTKDGWVYGEVKDYQKKTHPCLVPFNQLPKSERIKDHLVLTVVKECLRVRNSAGY